MTPEGTPHVGAAEQAVETAVEPAVEHVAAVLESVADVDTLPLDARLARFDAAHRALGEALGHPAQPR